MSESPDLHRTKALELAIQVNGTPAETVSRAHAYHEFLTGKGTGKPAAAAAAQTPAAAPKPAAAATGKPAAAATGKPAAAPKATPAPGTKPAAAPKAGAAAPKAAAPGTRPKGDTKDPNGNNTYDDVVAALRKVMAAIPNENKKNEGRDLAYRLLAEHGGGVTAVGNLKPELYDTVVAACEAVKPKAAAKPAAAKPAVAPKAATVVEDELGGTVDTSGASAETVGENDPPEGGSGEEDA